MHTGHFGLQLLCKKELIILHICVCSFCLFLITLFLLSFLLSLSIVDVCFCVGAYAVYICVCVCAIQLDIWTNTHKSSLVISYSRIKIWSKSKVSVMTTKSLLNVLLEKMDLFQLHLVKKKRKSVTCHGVTNSCRQIITRFV